MNDESRDAVRQWRAKAQSDWTTVEILLDSQRCPGETVCFHCQQFAEKLLKGILTANSVEAPKTHDLRRLIQLAEPFVPELSGLTDASDSLTAYGVETRYPDEWRVVQTREMNEMVKLARQFGELLLDKLDV